MHRTLAHAYKPDCPSTTLSLEPVFSHPSTGPSSSSVAKMSETKSQVDSVPEKSVEAGQDASAGSSTIDLLSYHEHNAGRLVIDPEYVVLSPDSFHVEQLTLRCREAKIEFGEAVAKKLKLSADGTKVLWPQPADDPEDPQNVMTTP